MSTPARTDRLESVEALRGVASLAVAWFHFTNAQGLLQTGWLRASGKFGSLGVPVFFVLSGFVIPYSLFKGGFRLSTDWRTFLLKRVVRLDPPYIVSIAVALGLTLLSAELPGFRGEPPHYSAPQLLAHLGYLNAFLGYEWVNPVFWTLAIEFQYYISAAIAFPVLFHHSAPVRFGALAAQVVMAYMFPNGAYLFHYMGLFCVGIVTCWYLIGLLTRPLFLLSMLGCTCVASATFGVWGAVAGACTALVIAFVRLPRYPAMATLGALSYPLYLLHVPIGGRVVIFTTRFPEQMHLLPVVVATLALAVAASLTAAYWLHLAVEAPAQRLSTRFRYSSKPLLTAEVAVAKRRPPR